MRHPEVYALGGWLTKSIATMARETLESPPPVLASILQNLKLKYSGKGAPWQLHLQVGVGTFEALVGDALGSGASPSGRRNAQPFPSDFSPSPVPQDLPAIAQDSAESSLVPFANRPAVRGG